MFKLSFVALLLLLIASCNNKESITTISIASAGCHSECPHMAIEINDSFMYKYYGGIFANKKGFYRGKVTKRRWDKLTYALSRSNYSTLDGSYYTDNEDLLLEIVIKTTNGTKKISGQLSGLPTDLKIIVKDIIATPNEVALFKVSDSLYFETKSQYLPQGIPKFLPDIKKH